jgi:DNA polymerase I-like protein with 3'-5' exonuclease and polymerase domains
VIYLVTGNRQLFYSEYYEVISLEKSLEIIENWDVVQFDTETSGRDPHCCKILCAQFGNKNADTQIVVDTSTTDILHYKNLLETKLLIGHNLKFDIQFLYNHSIIPTQVWDTMIIEQLLHLGFDNKFFHYSLKDVAERRLKIDIDKTTRGEIIWRGLDDKVVLYAAGDVMYLEDIRDLQIQDCKQRTCSKAAQIENAFVPVIAYLEWCGIRLDVNKWQNKIKDNERKRDEALEKLNQWVVDYYKRNGGQVDGCIEQDFTIMESIGGKCVFYDVPNDYVLMGTPTVYEEKTTDELLGLECIRRYVKIRRSCDYVTINNQGDLFGGWDLEPKCCINWASSRQTIPFFQMLGFDTTAKDKKTGDIKDSVVEKVLAKQKGIADDFLKLYFAYKEKFKDCSTYGQNYIDAINPNTDRIHTTFWQLGAASGRMSCGSRNTNTDLAHIKGIAPSRCKYVQLQNLPSDEITRGAFIPKEGNLMTACDYSALESRLGADIYNEPEMLEEFLHRSGDMHSLCAKLVFHEELKDVAIEDIKTLRPDLRKKVKPIEFSQQFGGGAGAVADALGCSREEAQKFVKAYADGFKGITEFKKKGSAFVRKYGYVLICEHTGHKLYWEDFKKWREIEDLPEYIYKREYTSEERKEHEGAAAKWDRMALNAPTQGSGIAILKLSMTLFFKWLCQEGYFNKVLLCNLVHDEAVIEYPEELKDIVVPKLKEYMEKGASVLCKKLPIPCVPETGNHWIH